MAKSRITARKWQGDDSHSWAVFIDGRPFVSGLHHTEVRYYKDQARKHLANETTQTNETNEIARDPSDHTRTRGS